MPPNERPTFSPFWHRVRAMRPKLRPHVQITRQRYRGKRWHVVHDPTSNQFYRLNPVAHDFVGTLDGSRTIDEAWKVSLSKFGDSAPTQNEVIQLIGQLYSSNLLSVDTTPETEQLLRRGRERVKKKAAAQAIGIMYFKIRMINPDRILTAVEPFFRPVINVWAFALWCVFLFAALAALTRAGAWPTLVGGFQDYIAPSNWHWIAVTFVVIKLWHELGHGVICKRYGGQVPEMGMMLLVLIPSPYVDASACWAFASKWKRIAVGAGGMIFELFAAAVAAFVWLSADQGSLTKQLAYNVMFTASVATVLFNANPLMRFDGYYILSDLLEVPNLAQRSNKMLQALCQKYLYRLRNVTFPSTLAGESTILVVYGVLAMMYRIFLFFTITLYVLGVAFAIGLLLAIWTASAWFIIPTGKFVHWLATSSQHGEHRQRSIGISLAMIAGVLILVGWVPMPDRRRGVGVVESLARAGLFTTSEGFVEEAHKRIGDRVEAGEAILTLSNPDLVAQRDAVESQIRENRVIERLALTQGEPGGAEIARERIRVLREQMEELNRRIDGLVVRAPQSGVIVTSNPELLLGAFIKRGDPVCEIVDTESVRVAAILDQRQAGWLAGLEPDSYKVEMRAVSDAHKLLVGGRVSTPGAGQRILPGPALGFEGGGTIETERDDRSGRIAKRPVFTVYVEPKSPEALLASTLPGARVHVRFTLEDRPWLAQWWERLERELQGRVKL
ncbi:MAG: PqqD family peptide modification chaperone [Phycisphaeraceae bacterium]|nr:PqqD family peptide modification chaperone [Phycisphaeraceae bacterium]